MDIGTSLRDAAQQGCCDTALRARAYMDVFTAFPQRSPNVYAVGQVLQTWCRLGGFEDSGLVAFPVAVLDTGTLIVGLLALGNADFQLGAATDPVG